MKKVLAALAVGFALYGLYALALHKAFASWRAPTNYRTVIKPVVLHNSDGGIIDNFVWFYEGLKDSGVPVVLDSICISACTLVLMLPKSQVCVMPGTSFGFHLASQGIGGTPLPEYTQILIRRYYPKAVRDWLKTKQLTLEITYMSYEEIINLGVFNACT